MKTKCKALMVGVLALSLILLMGPQSVIAAPPTGEVKTVVSYLGNGILMPYYELPTCNDWIQLLYDHVLGCTPEGKFSPELGLANKWEMSPDGLTWTFYLRRGVKFHDGAELTAKDVKFSMEELMRPGVAVNEAAFIKESLKSVEVKDPYTVVFYLKQPNLSLASLLSNMDSTAGMIIPKDYYERVGKDGFSKHPVGSGPYKFHSHSVGSFIKLEATDRHWRDGVPKYKYMTYLNIPEESTRLAMLKTGEADIARISREAVKEALNAGLNVVTKEDAAAVYFQANMQWTSPAFSDIRFRRALNLAIDRDALIKQILSGQGKPLAAYPGRSVSAIGGDLTLKPYPYNPEEARRLIKEGGWEGYEFNLMSYNRIGLPEYPLMVEAMAGYWQKIGLNPKIRVTEWASVVAAMRGQKTQNSIHGVDGISVGDVDAVRMKLEERLYFEHKAKRSVVNIPELSDRFKRVEKSLDIGEICRLLAEIHRYAYDHYLMIPICELPDKIATTKRIAKWDPGLRNDRNYYDLIKQR